VIFLDTGFLFALISAKDEHHERVLDVFRKLKPEGPADRLLSTNHVVAETITLVRRIGHEEATKIGDRLYLPSIENASSTLPGAPPAAV